MSLTQPAEGKHGAPGPCPTGLHMTLRGGYRTDQNKKRIKATINVIASLRSGVVAMVRMPGYVGENPQGTIPDQLNLFKC